jgi:BolA protein
MSDEIKSTCSCADKKEKVKKPVKQMGPIETSLFNKIQENLYPEFLKIRNDSWKHAHHSGMKTAGNTVESHFHITIVSDKFNEPLLKGSLARHRYIFKLLDDEVKKIHGFQVICKTPTEWEKSQTKTIPRESSAQYFS